MSTNKSYVIRRRVVQVKPTPVPESTYKQETFARRSVAPPIRADPRMEELAKPKVHAEDTSSIPPIPKYQNDAPHFDPVDCRVNRACLHRDVYLIRKQQQKEATDKENEPTEFLEWQAKMKELDEEERKSLILKRHRELDGVRKRAMKATKQRIEDRLEEGRKLRVQFGKDFENVQKEIEAEREKIRELKRQWVDKAPLAVARVKREKAQATKEMKKQMREELRGLQRRQKEELEEIKEKAATLRQAAESHTMFKGDKYSAKVEITETKFLSALTDEEATELLNKHREMERERIEREIEEHRRIKAEKMDKLVAMLEEATRYRDQKEEEFMKRKKERQEEEERLRKQKQQEEEQRMLELEKKLEKKRQERLKEAEEMEEHTRQIAARNRYLALNKKALATKMFQGQQDAQLRSAKERQTTRLTEERAKIGPSKPKPSGDMKGLKSLLGL